MQVEEKSEVDAEAGVTAPGWYFSSVGESTWNGPHSSQEQAETQGRSQTSFKRLLLNKCQHQFMKVLLPLTCLSLSLASVVEPSCSTAWCCVSVCLALLVRVIGFHWVWDGIGG